MDEAMSFVSGKEGELITLTRTNFVAPSPSRTTSCERCCVKVVRTFCMATPSGEVGEAMGGPPAAPLARMARVSLVLVLPSMLMALKERSTAWVRRGRRVEGGMGASVQRMPRRVAMFGWIMPAPLVMPAME